MQRSGHSVGVCTEANDEFLVCMNRERFGLREQRDTGLLEMAEVL